MKKLLIFASGTATGGGSGFQKLVESVKAGILEAEIVGVVSNHAEGGVYEKAKKLGIKFFHFPGPYTAENYAHYITETRADFVALSGWLKLTKGLPPDKTINIHPGPIPRFGGKGMYGHYVHEAVMEAYKKGEVTHSELCMHFVTDEYDKGPIFFRYPIEIFESDTADDLGARVNKEEHYWQPIITNAVINGEISWDGKDPQSLFISDKWKSLTSHIL